ncbi:membrane protein FAM174B, partial [Ochotona princeps]|uniref:membrane protein FAM174B n=1 Tax=Ochotona princeps TaxID=9978 RepID=UPI00271491F9
GAPKDERTPGSHGRLWRCGIPRRRAREPGQAPPAPWGHSRPNGSARRVGGGGGARAGSSGSCFLASTAQPPAPREPGSLGAGADGLSLRPRARALAARTMRPAPLLPLLLLALLPAPAARARTAESAPPPPPAPHKPERLPPAPGPANDTRPGGSNSSSDALVTRISTLLRDLPTLKATVIVACTLSALLVGCLLLRVFRSSRRLKKTRKYDIITMPAERVEMAPLNEEDDEEEDATVFDIKYR